MKLTIDPISGNSTLVMSKEDAMYLIQSLANQLCTAQGETPVGTAFPSTLVERNSTAWMNSTTFYVK